MKTLALILLLVVLTLLALAAPALAAPAAASSGLHTAHCKTMGTPAHEVVPFECVKSMTGCDMAGQTA